MPQFSAGLPPRRRFRASSSSGDTGITFSTTGSCLIRLLLCNVIRETDNLNGAMDLRKAIEELYREKEKPDRVIASFEELLGAETVATVQKRRSRNRCELRKDDQSQQE